MQNLLAFPACETYTKEFKSFSTTYTYYAGQNIVHWNRKTKRDGHITKGIKGEFETAKAAEHYFYNL